MGVEVGTWWCIVHRYAPDSKVHQGAGTCRENKKGARVDRCAKGRAAVTVRVYDPDTPSFVIEHQDAGLNQPLVVLVANHLIPHRANVAVIGPQSRVERVPELSAAVGQGGG